MPEAKVTEVIELDGETYDLGTLTVAELRAAEYDPLAKMDRLAALAVILRRTKTDDEITAFFRDHRLDLSTEVRQVVVSRPEQTDALDVAATSQGAVEADTVT